MVKKKFRLTATIGKRTEKLGTFQSPISVNKVINKGIELNKKFPTQEKKSITLEVMRGRKITFTKKFNL